MSILLKNDFTKVCSISITIPFHCIPNLKVKINKGADLGEGYQAPDKYNSDAPAKSGIIISALNNLKGIFPCQGKSADCQYYKKE